MHFELLIVTQYYAIIQLAEFFSFLVVLQIVISFKISILSDLICWFDYLFVCILPVKGKFKEGKDFPCIIHCFLKA